MSMPEILWARSRGNCKLWLSELNTPMLTSAVRTPWSRHEEHVMIKVQFRDCTEEQAMKFTDHTVAVFACPHPKSVRPESLTPTTTNPALIWAGSLYQSKGLNRPMVHYRHAAEVVRKCMPSLKKFVWSSVVLGLGFTKEEETTHHIVFNAGKVKKRQSSSMYTTINSQKWGPSASVMTVLTKEQIDKFAERRDQGAIAMVIFGKGEDKERNVNLQEILSKMHYEHCDAKKLKKMILESSTKPISLDATTLEILRKSVVDVVFMADSSTVDDDGSNMLKKLERCMGFLPPDQKEYEVLSVDVKKLTGSKGIVQCPDNEGNMTWVKWIMWRSWKGVVPQTQDVTTEPLGEDEQVIDLDEQTNDAFQHLENNNEDHDQDDIGPPQCKKPRFTDRGHDALAKLIEYAECMKKEFVDMKKEVVDTKKVVVDLSSSFKKYSEERKADCGQTAFLEIIMKEKERRQKEVLEVKWTDVQVKLLNRRARLFDPSRVGAFFEYAYQPFYKLMTKSSDPDYLHLQCHVCKTTYDLTAGNVEPLQRPSHLSMLATSEGVDLNPSQAKNLNERLRTHPTSVQHIANEKQLLAAAKQNGGDLEFMDDVLQQTPTERMIRTVFTERKNDHLTINMSIVHAKCPICFVQFDDDDIAALHCGHTFHHECVVKSLQNKKRCPLCRERTTEQQIIKKIFLVPIDESSSFSGNVNYEAKIEELSKALELEKKKHLKSRIDLKKAERNFVIRANKMKFDMYSEHDMKTRSFLRSLNEEKILRANLQKKYDERLREEKFLKKKDRSQQTKQWAGKRPQREKQGNTIRQSVEAAPLQFIPQPQISQQTQYSHQQPLYQQPFPQQMIGYNGFPAYQPLQAPYSAPGNFQQPNNNLYQTFVAGRGVR